MGKTTIITALLTAMLFVIPAAAILLPAAETFEDERRKVTAFPPLSAKMRNREIRKWFKDVDAFFADRFPLRSSFMALPRALYEESYSDIDMQACFRGKDNWLFLGNNYDRCIDKLQGAITLSEASLEKQTAEFMSRSAKAKEWGADFYILIGPNKSSVYPEFLPSFIKPAEQRFISPLVASLLANKVRVFDPTEHLLQSKHKGLLYYITDTHWNALGAYEAYCAFLANNSLPALPKLYFVDDGPRAGGDLIDIGGYRVYPLSTGDNFRIAGRSPVKTLTDTHFVNPSADNDKTVWVFADSFGIKLKPFIAMGYRNAFFFEHDQFSEMDASGQPRPDLVLWVHIERVFAQP